MVKEIIIDGVDVSGCPYYIDSDGSCSSHDCECIKCIHNVCFYKDYKAKEQECEELKKERDTLNITRDKLLSDLWVVEENLKDYTEHYNRQSEKLDQLKAENNKLKSELHSKVEFIQEQRNIIDEYSKEIRMYKKCQGNRASKREEKLKQTLAEIKEIAEILAPMTDEYEDCYDRDRCFECEFTDICKYFNIKQILQIISECEVENGN